MSERPIETCREWVDAKADRCNDPASFILWGKHFPPDALGPRCYTHAGQHLGMHAIHRIDQYAVFDLRNVRRAS